MNYSQSFEVLDHVDEKSHDRLLYRQFIALTTKQAKEKLREPKKAVLEILVPVWMLGILIVLNTFGGGIDTSIQDPNTMVNFCGKEQPTLGCIDVAVAPNSADAKALWKEVHSNLNTNQTRDLRVEFFADQSALEKASLEVTVGLSLLFFQEEPPGVIGFFNYSILVNQSRVFGQGAEELFISTGYLALQNAMELAIVNRNRQATGGQKLKIDLWASLLATGSSSFSAFLWCYYFIFSFQQFFGTMLMGLQHERHFKIKAGMRVMGLMDAAYLLSVMAIQVIANLFVVCLMLMVCYAFSLIVHTNVLIMFLLMFGFTMSMVPIAVLLTIPFPNPSTSTGISFLLFIVFLAGLGLANIFLFGSDAPPELTGLGAAALGIFSPVAFGHGIDLVSKYEQSGLGLQFSDWSSDYLCLGSCLGWLYLDVALYWLLAFYLTRIFPGEFGVGAPWNWCCGKRKQKSVATHEDDLYEPITKADYALDPTLATGEPSVKLRDLRKTYTKRGCSGGQEMVAVCGTNLDLYSGEVFALLGHNGAGKTTTCNMLSGFVAHTSGRASIYGYDLTTDADSLSGIVGVCPQYDILFDMLTAEEHITLFGAFKGVTHTKHEIETILKDYTLEDVIGTNKRVGDFSGGMKRKLSLAIAFMGDSQLVLLDEPTTGVDTVSRRQIWKTIQREKKGRCVVLTSHSMEEAETLGDRICIMSDGAVQMVGTVLFLKSQFSVGYYLRIKFREVFHNKGVREIEIKTITDIVQQHVSRASIVKDQSNLDQLVYVLPLDGEKGKSQTQSSKEMVNKFPALFDSFQANAELRSLISSYGVSQTSLEDVYLEVARREEEQRQKKDHEDEIKRGPSGGVSMNASENNKSVPPQPPHGDVPESTKMCSLIGLRFHSLRRDIRGISSSLFAPIVLMAVAIVMSKAIWSTLPQSQSSSAGIPNLPSTVDVLKPNSDHSGLVLPLMFTQNSDNNTREAWKVLQKSIEQQVNVSGLTFTEVPDRSALDDLTEGYGQFVPPTSVGGYIVDVIEGGVNGMPITRINATVLFSNDASFSSIVFDHMLMSALNKAVFPAFEMMGFLEPLDDPKAVDGYQTLENSILPSFTAFGLVFLLPFFTEGLIIERQQGHKEQISMAGVGPVTYYLSHLLVSLLLYWLSVIGAVAVLLVTWDPFLRDNALAFILPVMFFGVALIPLSHLLSHVFVKQDSAGPILGFVSAMTVFIPYFIIQFPYKNQVPDNTVFLLSAFLPPFNLLAALRDIADGINGRNPYTMEDILSPQRKVLPCVLLMILQGVLFEVLAIIVDARRTESGSCFAAKKQEELQSEDGASFWASQELHTNPDIRASLMSKSWDSIPIDKKLGYSAYQGDPEPTPVRDPNARTQVVVRWLRKEFESRTNLSNKERVVAVDDVSFVIQKGECFALLGPNGSGKTTTIKMLCGQLTADDGDAIIDNVSVRHDTKGVHAILGVCNQFDVLWTLVSVREHLTAFCQIKTGTASSVEYLIDLVGLRPHAHKMIKDLSGGNRRKVSIAMACVGSPKLVVLDEPTTGLDPVIRRTLWKIIQDVKGDRSVLLTSHAMDEVEYLCDYITVMVDGVVRAAGTTLDLKQKAQGYYVAIRTKDPSLAQDYLALIQREVCAEASIVYVVAGLVTLVLPTAFCLARLFEVMLFHFEGLENNVAEEGYEVVPSDNNNVMALQKKLKESLIDFAVNQASLDDVFGKIVHRARGTSEYD